MNIIGIYRYKVVHNTSEFYDLKDEIQCLIRNDKLGKYWANHGCNNSKAVWPQDVTGKARTITSGPNYRGSSQQALKKYAHDSYSPQWREYTTLCKRATIWRKRPITLHLWIRHWHGKFTTIWSRNTMFTIATSIMEVQLTSYITMLLKILKSTRNSSDQQPTRSSKAPLFMKGKLSYQPLFARLLNNQHWLQSSCWSKARQLTVS